MKRAYWAGGILTYALFLIAMAPAATIFRALDHFGPYKVMAESTSGTLWHGEARGIVLAAKGRQALHLGQASWSLHPLGLLLGRLSADLSFTGESNGHANIVLNAQRIRLQQVDLSFPAALLAYVNPGLNNYPLQGMLHISSQDLVLQTDDYQGRGELTWEQAGIALNKTQALGQYRLSASATGKDIALHLESNPDNPLSIDGAGTWSRKSGLTFNGRARAAEHEPELIALLGLMGQKQANGSYPIKLKRSGAN